jgi:hypothetical protein
MNREFIPYEQALALKELGFNEPCFGYYNYNGSHFFKYKPKTDDKNLTKAPLYQQAFRWFREKHGICSWIERLYTEYSVAYYKTNEEYKKDASSKMHNLIISLKEYSTYEEAELACLKKLIEIVKEE